MHQITPRNEQATPLIDPTLHAWKAIPFNRKPKKNPKRIKVQRSILMMPLTSVNRSPQWIRPQADEGFFPRTSPLVKSLESKANLKRSKSLPPLATKVGVPTFNKSKSMSQESSTQLYDERRVPDHHPSVRTSEKCIRNRYLLPNRCAPELMEADPFEEEESLRGLAFLEEHDDIWWENISSFAISIYMIRFLWTFCDVYHMIMIEYSVRNVLENRYDILKLFTSTQYIEFMGIYNRRPKLTMMLYRFIISYQT